jgi:hypothetical protein
MMRIIFTRHVRSLQGENATCQIGSCTWHIISIYYKYCNLRHELSLMLYNVGYGKYFAPIRLSAMFLVWIFH